LGTERRPLALTMNKTFLVSRDRPEIELEVTLETDGPLAAHLIVEANLALPGGVSDGDVAGMSLATPIDLGARTAVVICQPAMDTYYSLGLEPGTMVLYYPVQTVNNSEGGFERVVQGACLGAVRPIKFDAGEPSIHKFRLSVSTHPPAD
ncbi:MAG: DUF1926 domain-containing protein, partial [Candidatus Dormibacteraeota bacterium]|nr:DUF1926 domain-containing protein [Candidatus Dormibacteraeota bacterium]